MGWGAQSEVAGEVDEVVVCPAIAVDCDKNANALGG
jgi:hypothetical protein